MDKLYQFKLHYFDKVSQKETLLTDKLTRALTSNNLRRVHSSLQPCKKQREALKYAKEDFLYVCVTGMPPSKRQFEEIGIPGEKMFVYPQGFHPGTTEEESKERLDFAQLEIQAGLLHGRLKERKDKPIIFMIHSFGTTIMSAFIRLYYNEYIERVKGIIAIGAYTIRPDNSFRDHLGFIEEMTKEEILENVDDLYETHKELYKMMNLPANPNKYANAAYYYAFGQGMGFSEMFMYIRRWFPVLKCFIYGRQDSRIEESHLNESAIYYCHRRQFEEEYERKIKEVMKERYKIEADNVQERFVYNMDGGKHSIHLQKKFKPILSQIINEYLDVLEHV